MGSLAESSQLSLPPACTNALHSIVLFSLSANRQKQRLPVSSNVGETQQNVEHRVLLLFEKSRGSRTKCINACTAHKVWLSTNREGYVQGKAHAQTVYQALYTTNKKSPTFPLDRLLRSAYFAEHSTILYSTWLWELRPLPTGKRGSREPNRHLHDRTDFKMKKKMLFVLIWQLLPSISNLCHAQFALISNWGCPPSHSCTMYSVPTALQLRSLLLHCLNFFAGLGQGKA
eukprot:1149164-Pelagomonas_calceolata.AAC.2